MYATGLPYDLYSSTDNYGNVFLSGTVLGEIQELPHAYVSPATLLEPAATGGMDSIQVLPATQLLSGAYAPVVSSNAPWLTVTSAGNGTVQFSFAPNSTGPERTATITVLGVSVTVTQSQYQGPASMSIASGNYQFTGDGSAFPAALQVQVLDQNGNPKDGVQVNFSVSSGAVSLSASSAVTNANGIASVQAIAQGMGNMSVTATIPGTSIPPVTFNLIGYANGMAISSGNNQNAPVNQPYGNNLQVIVYSPDGTPQSGVTVTFATPGSGPSATFAGGVFTAQTGANGIATAPALTANGITGTFTVTAYISDSASGAVTSVTFNLFNFTPLMMIAGNGESVPINTPLSPSPTVEALDNNGNPVANVAVTFTVNAGSSGASAAFAGPANSVVVTTGSNGIATAPTLTVNGTTGGFTVVASSPGRPSITFTANNVIGAFSSGSGQTGPTTRTLPQPFVVQSVNSSATKMTFTVVPDPNTGASGTFNGADTATVNLDNQSYGTSPQLTTNGIPGTITIQASDGITEYVGSASTTECLNPGGGSVVVTAANDSSLRSAVNNACAGSTIDMTQITGTITLTQGRLRIDDNMTLVGPGAGSLAIDGGSSTRLFFIGNGAVSISGVTLQNGLGAGSDSSAGGGGAGMGGAIFMEGGNVTLTNVVFSGNEALGGTQGAILTIDTTFGGGFAGTPAQNRAYTGPIYAASGDLFGIPGTGEPGAGGSPCPTGHYSNSQYATNGGFGGGGGGCASDEYGVTNFAANGGFGGGGGAGVDSSIEPVTPGVGGFGGGTGSLANFGYDFPVDDQTGGGGAGFGGAIFQYAGTLTLNNDQFTGNSAVGGTSDGGEQANTCWAYHWPG